MESAPNQKQLLISKSESAIYTAAFDFAGDGPGNGVRLAGPLERHRADDGIPTTWPSGELGVDPQNAASMKESALGGRREKTSKRPHQYAPAYIIEMGKWQMHTS